ncbi:MAG: multiheme c-type cytochrome [Planctomycetota bacterium]
MRFPTQARASRARWTLLVAGLTLSTPALLIWTTRAHAYERYDQGCNTCHGSFSGSTSPKGTVFPSGSKHTMHRSSSYMATACNLCHVSGSYSPVYLGHSAGTANNPGVGCNGCHGENYGGTIGHSGVGLRRHHALHNVSSCAGCHQNDPLVPAENVKPTYYHTADTRADDACNAAPGYLENWSVGDTDGLDNDGDGFRDALDRDCGSRGPGDLNCDGAVNFGDINPFVIALSDPAGHQAAFPGCALLHGDCNGDGHVDFGDINPFVALLAGD